MKYPAWLGTLGKKEEQLRASLGLFPATDGWYKTVNMKKRYIARPMPLADVKAILPARIDELKGVVKEKASTLAVNATTIDGLAEMFLAHLWQRHVTGSPRPMRRRTYDDYVAVLERFTNLVGGTQPAIAVHASWFTMFMRTISDKAATTQRREIIYLTAFFNWAGPGRHSLNFYKEPVKFGADFRKPGEAIIRSALAEYSTLYTPEQYAEALNAVAPSPLLYAMGLLALNCAFLPEDVSSVPLSAFDFTTNTVSFPRQKTGVPRKAFLMPLTAEAIQRYLIDRSPKASPDGPLFVRLDGKSFDGRREVGPERRSGHSHALAQYWGGITGRPLKGLRTTFATEADGVVDQAAVDLVMGHAAKTIRAKHYVKSFAPERLKSVIEHVWQRVAPQGPLPAVASISPSGLVRRVGSRVATLSKLQRPRVVSGNAAA